MDFLYGVAIALILLNFRWSAAMRDRAERMTRFKPIQTLVYWLQYLLVTTILGAPLGLYEGFFRERKYGLATQTFGPWMGDQLKGLLVSAVLGGIIAMLLFGVVRRLERTWHVWAAIVTFLFLVFVVLAGFALLRRSLEWSLASWGEKWQIRGIGDTAVLPLVVLLASIFFFVLTPILNTHTRTVEREADMYGLNASRQPDGFAQAAIHLGEYRKMSPGPIEEWIFFDHPSGRNRILAAMRWTAENRALFTTPASTGNAA